MGRCQVLVLTNVPTKIVLSMIDEPVELRKGIQINKMEDGWKGFDVFILRLVTKIRKKRERIQREGKREGIASKRTKREIRLLVETH